MSKLSIKSITNLSRCEQCGLDVYRIRWDLFW